MATITTRSKADGSLSYRVMIRIKQKGKVIFQESKTFSKEAAAKRWSKKREVELEDDSTLNKAIHNKSHKITVGQLVKKYVDVVKPIKQWGKSKSQTLSALQRYDIAELDAFSLKPQDIINHCIQRVEKHGAKPQTVNQDIIYLRGVFDIAEHLLGVPVDSGAFIKAKPILKKLGLVKSSNERDRRPEYDEITEIVSRAYKYRHGNHHLSHDYAPMDKIIVFAMFSIRRLSEICRITWDDLDEDKKTIIVRDMKDPNEKVGNDVEVHLTDEALAVIQSMPKVDERIFPFNHRSVGANFQRLRAKAGFEYENIDDNLRFHDLRHEGISWLFEKNGHEGEVWDIPKVAKVSGHKSWSSLQIYEDIISPEPRDRWSDWEWKTKVLD